MLSWLSWSSQLSGSLSCSGLPSFSWLFFLVEPVVPVVPVFPVVLVSPVFLVVADVSVVPVVPVPFLSLLTARVSGTIGAD